MKRALFLLLLIATTACLTKGPGEEAQKFILDNGLTLIVKENHANSIVATKLLVKTGATSETQAEMGIRNFVQETLLKGTSKRTAEDIAFETDSKGIVLTTGVADDYLEITMVSTEDFFESGLDILADVVMNPSFPEKEVEAERTRILEGLRAQQDDQFTITRLLFQGELYGEHPYGYNPLGTRESINGIKRESLLRFHQGQYAPNNIVVAVVGDVGADGAKRIIEEKFRDFKQRELVKKPSFEIRGGGGNTSLEKEREQTFIVAGYLAAPVTNQDYPSLKVLSSLLGGGTSSRLYVDLREKQGLAYQVGSFYPSRVEASFLAAYIGTATENEEAVLELLLREFEDLKSKPISQEEFAIAKNSLVGDFELDHESNERQAFYLAWYEAIGMGHAYDRKYTSDVEKVTADDLQRVAKKYLNKPVVARVGQS